jgi:hypothetical protein
LDLPEKIFKIQTEEEFNLVSLSIFRKQYEENKVYKGFAERFCKDPLSVKAYFDIPFLPIEFFKREKVVCRNPVSQAVFKSSGTTVTGTSTHYVTDLSVYERSAIKSFELNYGDLKDYTILALLPSFAERGDSSLAWMTNLFISKSNFKNDCGFFLDNDFLLIEKLTELQKFPQRKIILLGVSHALLGLAEKIKIPLKNSIIMETGGMKGKRKELVREELHKILCESFGVGVIHSEYGMTEMLSQAYSKGKGLFKSPPWMKILIREMNDPLSLAATGKTGGINVIDLANINSCSFVATQDLGKTKENGTFEVLGRFDNSDVRGCNLMTGN